MNLAVTSTESSWAEALGDRWTPDLILEILVLAAFDGDGFPLFGHNFPIEDHRLEIGRDCYGDCCS